MRVGTAAAAGLALLLGACLNSPPGAASCEPAGTGCRVFTCEGQGGCFLFCDEPVEYTAADGVCRGWGGVLVPVISSDLDVCLAEQAAGANIWIGLTQMDGEDAPDSGWTWANGDPIGPYTNWRSGEPGDSMAGETGAEQCAEKGIIGFFGGGWNDLDCTRHNAFVCAS